MSTILTLHAGVCLRNAEAYRQQQAAQTRLRATTELLATLQAETDNGVNGLVFTLTEQARAAVPPSAACLRALGSR